MRARLFLLAAAVLAPTAASAHPGLHALAEGGSDALATVMLGAFALLVAARTIRAVAGRVASIGPIAA